MVSSSLARVRASLNFTVSVKKAFGVPLVGIYRFTYRAGLGRAGLGWAGLGWAGLGWAGLGWAGLGWAEPQPFMENAGVH